MDDFQGYFKKHSEFRKKRDELQKDASKQRLLKATKKKVQTTMIGALDSVEKHLGFLWNVENPGLQENQLRNIFEDLRSEILDRGNNQMRSLENEFSHYDVTWKRYNIQLPFVDKGD